MRCLAPMLLALGGLTGCAPPATSPPAPPSRIGPTPPAPSPPPAAYAPPSIPSLASPGCSFGPLRGTLVNGLGFELDGRRLATVGGEVTVHQLQVSRDGERAWADVDDGRLRLAGPVRPTSVRLRPVAPLVVDGWLEIEEATIGKVTDAEAELVLRLPDAFEATSVPTVRRPCAELAPIDSKAEAKTGLHRVKEGARAPLRATPKGPVVGHLLGPKPKPEPKVLGALGEVGPFMDLDRLEEQGALARVRLRGSGSAVVGWIPKEHLAKGTLGLLGMLQDGPYREGDHVTCTEEVALVAESAAGTVTVGALHANRAVPAAKQPDGSIALRLFGSTLDALLSGRAPAVMPVIEPPLTKVCTVGPR